MTDFVKYYQFAILAAKLQQISLDMAKDLAQRQEVRRICELGARKSESFRQDLMLKLRSDSYRDMQTDFNSEDALAIVNVVMELMECWSVSEVEDEIIKSIKQIKLCTDNNASQN
jgi:hypothetical protein